jgi:hypothetical protein
MWWAICCLEYSPYKHHAYVDDRVSPLMAIDGDHWYDHPRYVDDDADPILMVANDRSPYRKSIQLTVQQ